MGNETPSSSISAGFTLIELLVVIAIIGILSSVVLASLGAARGKSRDAIRATNLHSIETALQLYINTNGSLAPMGASLGNSFYSETNYMPVNGTTGQVASALQPTYMSTVPNDPITTNTSLLGYRAFFYYLACPTPAWITANAWAKMTQACANHCVLVAEQTENAGNYRQDCAMSDTSTMSIVVQ